MAELRVLGDLDTSRLRVLGDVDAASPVSSQAERDRAIVETKARGDETTAQRFRRGFSEGFGGGAPLGEAVAGGPIPLVTQPVRALGSLVSGITRGVQEALPRDIAAMPEAFAGSPGMFAMPQMAAKLPELKGSVEGKIADKYRRAVKPSVSGKQTAAQVERYADQARDAIGSIVSNKPNLVFTDAATGVVRRGELPQSLEDFGDAIEQTKQSIFNQYDDLAKTAEGKGATVSLSPISDELRRVAADQVTELMHPELAKYAESAAARFDKAGSLSPGTAQRAIAVLNSSLKAFYRNPTYDNAAKANIDAMIANQLRGGLDEAIEAAGEAGYQDLKNQYGSLKAIEKDVNNRAQVVARQEKGGGILGRIADVGSAEEVIRGFLTLNPVAVARGGLLKGWAELVKFRRSPNRAVTDLFRKAEQAQSPPSPTMMSISPMMPQLGILAARQPTGLEAAQP